MTERWPYKTDGDLRAAGYRFDRNGVCTGPNCRKKIEWWLTAKGKWMPIDPGTMEPHWSTCVDRKQFKK